jgi:hypothetical protein
MHGMNNGVCTLQKVRDIGTAIWLQMPGICQTMRFRNFSSFRSLSPCTRILLTQGY